MGMETGFLIYTAFCLALGGLGIYCAWKANHTK